MLLHSTLTPTKKIIVRFMEGFSNRKKIHIQATQMPNKKNIKIKKETKRKSEYLHKTMISHI